MAKNRRSVQAKLDEAQRKAAAYDALQAKVSGFLENEGGEGFEDLDHFREATEQVISQTRSEAEQANLKNQKMEKQLELARKAEAETFQNYANAMISRQITDEASDLVVEGPGREGAIEYFQLKLGQLAEFNKDTGDVSIKWDVTDPDTNTTSKQNVSVKQVLKDMEANPSKYGRYFRSTVNSGDGGEVLDGVKRTSDGNIDFASMSGEDGFRKFKELKQKNPGLFNQAVNRLTLDD